MYFMNISNDNELDRFFFKGEDFQSLEKAKRLLKSLVLKVLSPQFL
jgi:hypothetical protein